MKVKLDKVIEGGVVTKVKHALCMKHVDSIKNLKNFSQIWINGSNLVKKDFIQKHSNDEALKKANDLEQRKTLGGAKFIDKVVKDTPIWRGLSKMTEKDFETLRVCFNSANYLVKQQQSFSDNPNLFFLQQKYGVKNFKSYVTNQAATEFTDHINKVSKDELVETIQKSKYFSLLIDGSIYSAMI